jgi:hypothetical protein
MADRHPGTVALLRWFEFGHLPPELGAVSRILYDAAHQLVDRLGDGPELTTALRKLLEGKDAAVRQAIADRDDVPAVRSAAEQTAPAGVPRMTAPDELEAQPPGPQFVQPAVRPRVREYPQA